jgi:hypothetical protein
MATVSIWYRHESKPPEVCDRATSPKEAEYLAHEYAMAFGCLPGQHRYRKDKVWAGRKDQEPMTGRREYDEY